MDREHHRRLRQIVEELADLGADEQARRLAALRQEDAELSVEVARMLAAQGGAPTVALRGVAAADTVASGPPAAQDLATLGTLERIGHYRLEHKLGAGGMGEVHAAVDERLGRRVAIKLLPAAAEWRTSSRLRMLREAQAASALNHPGIVTLFDVEVHEGRLALVMELVDGDSFHRLARGGLPPAEALRLTAEVADALAAAHAAGVLHRDIKSDNLMRTRDGRVKVLDFGVAKLVGDAARGRSSKVWELASSPAETAETAQAGDDGGAPRVLETRAGAVVGTPAYMAPEQTRGDPPTTRSDVFSLGVVLYELLTGARPFARGSLADTLAAVRGEDLEPPSRRVPGLDPAVDAVVLRATARDPAQRFADMRELAAAIRAIGAKRGRRRWPIAAGAVLLTGAALAAAFLATRRPAGPVVRGTARRLTYDLGCEENPSFTPDGKTLVFDAQVDGDYELLALDLASGARRRLTHDPGWDYSAKVSPDGAWVAYIHQGETSGTRVLPLDPPGGGPILVGRSDGYPAWTSRGTLLLSDLDRIREWRPTGGGLRDVATLPAKRRAVYFAPFADGKVAVVLGTTDQEVKPQLALLDGDRLEILPIDDAAEYPIAPAPSGTDLYYQRTAAAELELVRLPRSGRGRAALVEGGLSATGGFSFAPDGKRLAYSTCRSATSLARIAGGHEEMLTRSGGWADGNPVAFGDDQLLFTSDRSGESQVWRLHLASGAVEPVTEPGTLRPALSVDRRRLAWAVYEPPGIVVADLDAGGMPGPARRLTDRRGDTGPQFTSDGANLVFVRLDERGGERVWVVPVAGGEPRPLAPPHSGVASASPVADEIVFVRQTAAGIDLVATNLAADGERVLASLPAGWYRSLRHSPDGERLILIHEEQEILEIDRAGAVKSLWKGGSRATMAAEYAPDGRSVLASVVTWEGDLWMVDGRF